MAALIKRAMNQKLCMCPHTTSDVIMGQVLVRGRPSGAIFKATPRFDFISFCSNNSYCK